MLFFTKAVTNLHSHQCLRGSPFSAVPLQHLLFVDFWYGHSDQLKVMLLWIFDLHSFNIEWYWEILRVNFFKRLSKIYSLKFAFYSPALFWIPTRLPIPGHYLRTVISRLTGLGSNTCPSVISSKTVITRMATRWQDIFIPRWLLEPHRLSECCISGL